MGSTRAGVSGSGRDATFDSGQSRIGREGGEQSVISLNALNSQILGGAGASLAAGQIVQQNSTASTGQGPSNLGEFLSLLYGGGNNQSFSPFHHRSS